MARPSAWVPMTEPVAIAVLAKLGEELSEGSAASFRCIMQGIDEVEPVTRKPNRVWLEEELADILAQVRRTITFFDLNADFIEERAANKLAYTTQWHDGIVPKCPIMEEVEKAVG